MVKTARARRSGQKSKKTSAKTSRSPKGQTPKAPPPLDIKFRILGQAKAPKAVGAKEANTVIYVHGIANKPPASVLKCQWDSALFGTALGDRSRMAYWVNRDYYPQPLDETCSQGDHVEIDDDEVTSRMILALARGETADAETAVDQEIKALSDDQIRRNWMKRIANKMRDTGPAPSDQYHTRDVHSKFLPLPGPVRRWITEKLSRAFLRDVNDFFFVKSRREAMEQKLLDRIAAGGGPFVVVAHSQGSMIAYNVLRRLKREQCEVPLLVTIGSPLGIQEVQDVFRQWTGGTLRVPTCVDRWVNVADRLDPVALDSDISNDFEGKIDNSLVTNPDSPRHPHSATGYLRTQPVQDAIREVLGTPFHQAIAPFALAKDLVADLENGDRKDRHSTLIQIADSSSADAHKPQMLQAIGDAVERKIIELVKAGDGSPADAEMDRLKHFVTAKLTRIEVETLRSYFDDLSITGIWRNAQKRALITTSTHTIQVRPANLGYGANGKNICWAVLDTGIAAAHPHFDKYKNVVLQWDCTKRGEPKKIEPKAEGFADLDKNGHGTHVAGIIAGSYAFADGELFAGMAPECSLYGFKVLDDQGNGDDAWIIKALDAVAGINETSGALVIQGINLSLGGGFDPSVFGCGHTPLCQELRRLWRQGVVVCLAAGNEGYAVLSSAAGEIQANLDLTIGDPANLEEAIAVGSVHKSNPHTYGISYFSSRGPTADGRQKPDVVAPGERILSARHDWSRKRATDRLTRDNLYVEMSGTSMATPHVSGLLAAFLSMRREFIGYPDQVKSMLLQGCINLQRDAYMQGAGLPNLIKMLALN